MTPKFIIEEPANSDELDGHARVARALAEAIKSEKRLRYLGILGRWGSGKSTVVRMLEGQLREEDQTWLVFTLSSLTAVGAARLSSGHGPLGYRPKSDPPEVR